MESNSEDISNHRGPWQFTLRSLMIGVTVICIILNFGSWLGLRGYIGSLFAVVLGILAFAVYKRRKIVAILCAVLLAGSVLYYYYGYWTVAKDVCLTCGKQKIIILIGGVNANSIECYSEEQETYLYNWYQKIGLKNHNHRWRALWADEQRWGGEVACYDNLPPFTLAGLLHDISEKVDKATFENLLKDYRKKDMNPATVSELYDRCEQILSSEN